MFARVSVYEIADGRMDDAVKSFGSAFEEIRKLDGFSDAFFLVSNEDDRATTMTLWTSRGALEASRTAGSRLRTAAARSVDGAVVSAQEYEVALHIVGRE